VSRYLSAIFRALAGLLVLAAAAFAQELPNAPAAGARVDTAMLIADNAGTATLPAGNAATPLADPASPLALHSAALIEKARDRVQVHRFFDKTNWTLLGVASAALAADGTTTMNRLGKIRTEYQVVNGVSTPVQMRVTEADPVGKIFVNHGWPGTIAGGAVTIGADLGLQYLLHRTHHHRLERIVPLLFAASNAAAAIHNTHY
jgi:hypothetical protein